MYESTLKTPTLWGNSCSKSKLTIKTLEQHLKIFPRLFIFDFEQDFAQHVGERA